MRICHVSLLYFKRAGELAAWQRYLRGLDAPGTKSNSVTKWRRKRDSLVRNSLIIHKLLIFQLARLA